RPGDGRDADPAELAGADAGRVERVPAAVLEAAGAAGRGGGPADQRGPDVGRAAEATGPRLPRRRGPRAGAVDGDPGQPGGGGRTAVSPGVQSDGPPAGVAVPAAGRPGEAEGVSEVVFLAPPCWLPGYRPPRQLLVVVVEGGATAEPTNEKVLLALLPSV